MATRPKKIKTKKTVAKKKNVAKKKKTVCRKKKKINKSKSRSTVKKTKTQTKKLTEPITFGLLENEINELIDKYSGTTNEQQAQKNIIDQLIKMLPTDEAIVTSKEPKSHNIVIKNIRRRHEHSPYVLNLSKLIKDRQTKFAHKQSVKNQLSNLPNTKNHETNIVAKHMPITQVKQTKLTKAQIKKQFTKNHVLARQPWFRPALAFALVCLVVVLPIKAFTYYKEITNSKNKVLNYSQQAYEDLKIASQAIIDNDSDLAQTKFSQAKTNFDQAQNQLNNINEFLATAISVVPKGGQYLTDAKRLTWAGEQIAEIGSDVTIIFDKFYQDQDSLLTDKILIVQDEINNLLPKIQNVTKEINLIDPQVLPENLQTKFIEIKTQLNNIENYLEEISEFSGQLADILGHHYKRRYLFIFQNNNEIRATGGFMGSLALVDIHNGKIENIEMPGGGTYDLQGSLAANLEAPYPLQLINGRWEFQDANWFFDFPTSAKKIQWFYERAAGPSVDGVIAINATQIEELLKYTEPIQLPNYNKIITADNFILETQKAVELEYDRQENKPKQFLADLAPIFIEQIFDPQKTDLLKVIQSIKQGLDEKEIMMYFNNLQTQNIIFEHDWSGEVKSTSKDYLAIVNTNIAGGKTDAHIQQQIEHISQIQADGSIIDTVTITRKHLGQENDLFGGVRNVNYLRIYVPQGSQLIRAQGFEAPPAELFDIKENYSVADKDLNSLEQNKQIFTDTDTVSYDIYDKTVFANWTQTDPQEQTTVSVSYKLPYKIQINQPNIWQNLYYQYFTRKKPQKFYSLFYQKQPGSQNTSVVSKLILPNYLQASWVYPQSGIISSDNLETSFQFNTDQLFGINLQLK